MPQARLEKSLRAVPRLRILLARSSPEEVSMAGTCCPARSTIARRRRRYAASLPPGCPSMQAGYGRCVHPHLVGRAVPESKSESRDLVRALSETFPACGWHRETAFGKQIQREWLFLRCPEVLRGFEIRRSVARQLL